MKNLRLHTSPILCFNDMTKNQNIPLAPLKRGMRGVCLALWLCLPAAVQAQNQTPLTPRPFVTVWRIADTNNDGSISEDEGRITIPTTANEKFIKTLHYNYTVDWGDGNTSSNQRGNATHTYRTADDYRVTITGTFPRIYFNVEPLPPNATAKKENAAKLREVKQWGSQAWTSMASAFKGCSQLQITATDAPNLSKVTDMSEMFRSCSALTGHVSMSDWDVSNVTTMIRMFAAARAFNQPLNEWNVSKVTYMRGMFQGARAFNQPLDKWKVFNVTDMEFMFSGARTFNQPLNKWNVSKVTDMTGMFAGAMAFNQPLDKWKVSNVTDMEFMFAGARAFNQPLNEWDVSNVTRMDRMFSGARAFNQPLDKWNVSSVTNMSEMFRRAAAFSSDNYVGLLMAWAGKLPTKSSDDRNDYSFAPPGQYCATAEAALNTLKHTKGWRFENDLGAMHTVYRVIPPNTPLDLTQPAIAQAGDGETLTYWTTLTDNGTLSGELTGSERTVSPSQSTTYYIKKESLPCPIIPVKVTLAPAGSFVTVWRTTTADESITIPTSPNEATRYDYSIDWGDGNTSSNQSGNPTHIYRTAGDHIVTITGTFPRIYFNNVGDKDKIREVRQWGSQAWTSMASAFKGCTNLQITAADVPNLSQVTDMREMFSRATALNQPLNKWNVSSVTNMSGMFEGARAFNQPLNRWNVSKVTNMSGMFEGARAFNQPLNRWDVSKVTSMKKMFTDARALARRHYTQLLIDWAERLQRKPDNAGEDSYSLGTPPTKYCASAQTAVDTWQARRWRFESDQGAATVAAPQGDDAQPFCAGATIGNLAATGDNIQWYASEEGTDALAGSHALASDTYYATQTLNGCESTARLEVTVTLTPRAEAAFHYGSDASAMRAAFAQDAADPAPSQASGSFTSEPSGLSLDATSGVIDLSASQVNTYTITHTTGECPSPATFVVQVTPAAMSLHTPQASALQVSPVPTASVLHLRLTQPAVGRLALRLSTPTGAVVLTHTPQKAGEVWQHTLDLSDLPKGVYMLEVMGETQRWKRKVVIQ